MFHQHIHNPTAPPENGFLRPIGTVGDVVKKTRPAIPSLVQVNQRRSKSDITGNGRFEHRGKFARSDVHRAAPHLRTHSPDCGE
jgi:hypothetical protein